MTNKMELYSETAKEWLEKWDNNEVVWSIEMGGLGPGYEQCIHITCAEILRFLINKNYDASEWDNKEKWYSDRKEIDEMGFSNKTIKALGISGAQWNAALFLALAFYQKGIKAVMEDDNICKDRHIQVQKRFPGPWEEVKNARNKL